MSASSLVTIFCDAPSCGRWEDRGISHVASEARRQLRGTGWQLNVPDPDGGRQRLDFCPTHATTPTPTRRASSEPPESIPFHDVQPGGAA